MQSILSESIFRHRLPITTGVEMDPNTKPVPFYCCELLKIRGIRARARKYYWISVLLILKKQNLFLVAGAGCHFAALPSFVNGPTALHCSAQQQQQHCTQQQSHAELIGGSSSTSCHCFGSPTLPCRSHYKKNPSTTSRKLSLFQS